MSSRFWWKLRELWHSPEFNHSRSYEFAFYWKLPKESKINPWRWRPAFSLYRICPRRLREDIVNVFRLLYWQMLWLQPLRCNGNGGGWRTRFCEWLENKARQAEDREDTQQGLHNNPKFAEWQRLCEESNLEDNP